MRESDAAILEALRVQRASRRVAARVDADKSGPPQPTSCEINPSNMKQRPADAWSAWLARTTWWGAAWLAFGSALAYTSTPPHGTGATRTVLGAMAVASVAVLFSMAWWAHATRRREQANARAWDAWRMAHAIWRADAEERAWAEEYGDGWRDARAARAE